jgi:hypothetical protein
MVELIGRYPVHDHLGLGGDEEVKRRTAGTVAPVGLGQSVGSYLSGTAVGLGDETACRMGLEPEHHLDLLHRRACLEAHGILLLAQYAP